ncbi:MAG TPA: branched-chain amino acid transaminase [Acidimicrobiales bacterium]
MIEPVDIVWVDGELGSMDRSRVSLLTHTMHYGFGVFDGLRSYRQDSGDVMLFRALEHMERVVRSAEGISIPVAYDADALVEAAQAVLRANELDDAYVRPLVYVGEPNIIFSHWLNSVHVAMIAFPWTGYSDRNRERGSSAKIAPWPRPKALADLYKFKACGHYLLNVTAFSEAQRSGFGQAIFVDEDGAVCEATGENVFVVKDGAVATPPSSRSILPGITRDTVLTLARDLGHEAVERDLVVDDLLGADEVFTTGTASELLPLPKIEDRVIGDGTMGPVTAAIQQRFSDAVRGREPAYADWLTKV